MYQQQIYNLGVPGGERLIFILFMFYWGDFMLNTGVGVIINGLAQPAEGSILTDWLAANNYNPARIAVEKNGEIVPKAQYQSTVLQAGDVLEIVSFVGGG